MRSFQSFVLAVVVSACNGVVHDPPGDRPPDGGPGTRPPSTADIASESGARRLTTHELDNTIDELLGDDRGRASALLVVDEFTPFDNDYTNQLASEALITGLEIFATDVADYVMGDPTLRDAAVPCTPSGADDATCFRAFIEDFVPKAFRRPITEEEIGAYMTLQSFSTEVVAGVDNDFYTGIGLVIRAVLQDPEFLYRIEVGTETDDEGVLALDGWEIAARMSYFLWASTPDDTLLAEAASGALETPEGRRTAAIRMLDDARAREQLHRFHTMWLGYRVLPHDQDLVSDFSMETNALIDRVVFDEPQSYLNMMTFDETYLNDELAAHYGLPAPGGEGWVPYGDSGRAGVLSHGSILSAFAKFADTSPTQRGILIRTRLMCQAIRPPPPTIDVDDEPVGESPDDCKYERYSAHREQTGCSSCHNQMDPIGFGLENFDMAGRFREHDEGRPECVIAGDGALPDGSPDGIPFNGPAELGQLLLDHGYIESCVMQQLYGFAIGREAVGAELDAVDELVTEFGAVGHDLRELITEFVASERFAHRREEAL